MVRQASSFSGSPLTVSRPPASGAYYAASVLYNAGFRGWPLTIMTAISGRESSWRPTALNNNPSTEDYSVGLFQLNYFGSLAPGRTQAWGTPAQLLNNPQAQANATYQLVGGNSLSGLSNWNMTVPANGQIPTPLSNPSTYTIAPYMPQALAAVAQVAQYGPAPGSVTAQVTQWPGTSGAPAVTTGTGFGTTSAQLLSATSGQENPNSKDCNTKGKNGDGVIFNLDPVSAVPVIGHLAPSANFTYCQLKGLIGGFLMISGGVIAIASVFAIVAGKSPIGALVGGFAAGRKTAPKVSAPEPSATEFEASPTRRGSASSRGTERSVSMSDLGGDEEPF